MKALVTGTILTARHRSDKDGVMTPYVDLYLLQEGERTPVVAYADAAALPSLPSAGEAVEADCEVFPSRFGGNSIAVKVTRLRCA